MTIIPLTVELISQIAIMGTGISAAWLINDHRYDHRKYACLIAMFGQPFWWYTTFEAGQWGIFTLSVFYTISWSKGINNYWIKKR